MPRRRADNIQRLQFYRKSKVNGFQRLRQLGGFHVRFARVEVAEKQVIE